MNKKDLRIVYLGTPKISAIVLEKLIENGYNILAVVSQADKPQGRKMVLTPTETKLIAQKHNIPVYQPIKIRDDYTFLDELKPEILLTMAYGQIIPQAVLDIPKIKALNLHGSILPKYRGASPIQAALLNGDKTTGITLMEMIDKMDAGNMFYKKEIDILDEDNYETLSLKLANLAYETFDEGIESVLNGENGDVQDENLVTFTKKIKPEESELKFSESAENLVNKIRAFYNDPGTYFVTKINGQDTKIKVNKAEVIKKESTKPGNIFEYDKNGFIIETSSNMISILSLQLPGKKMLDFKSFFNGNQKLFEKNTNI